MKSALPKKSSCTQLDQQEIQIPRICVADSFPTNSTADTGKGITDSFLDSGIGESQQ